MYRHLLVPIDGTDPSIELVGNAVGLAQAVGARITFFHAGEHDAARATELLAKAEAASHASGVPCNSSRAMQGSPGAAIAEAARSNDCDLIFMSAPPQPVAALAASSTLDGLLQAGLPVLWSSQSTGPAAHAIGVLRDEHRSLAAVLHAWIEALATALAADCPADPVLMRSMVRYLQLFAVELHHPKEERHLFRRLRLRTDDVTAELDELERQHVRDRELLAELARGVEALADVGTVEATRKLEAAVQRYAAFQWEHLGREEGVVLPAALRHLGAADWSAIDVGFAGDRDPGFDGAAGTQLRQLFARIVDAPEHTGG